MFADATDCTRLLYWGAISDIHIDDGGTSYSVEGLSPIGHGRTPQDLVLRSTGKQIAPDFIRPYAICRTPEFLHDRPRHNTRLQPSPLGGKVKRRG